MMVDRMSNVRDGDLVGVEGKDVSVQETSLRSVTVLIEHLANKK